MNRFQVEILPEAEAEIREAFRILNRFPYTVHYDLVETKATVLAVSHHRRMPGYWRERK